MKNVRLQDIANRLNLTKVSVSKALRDHSDISLETRKRVKKMAEEMGYQPNQIARSLTSRKTKTLGVIVPKVAHFFFSHVIEGIYNVASEKGYDVILGVSLEDEKMEKDQLESILRMRVDGLLVSVSQKTDKVDAFLVAKKMGIPLVFFDRVFEEQGFSCVKVEDRRSAMKGVRELIKDGYRTVAHLAGYEYVDIGREREAGYREALEAEGIEVDEDLIVRGGFSEKSGYEGMKTLVERSGVPETIFVVTYPVGLGALDYMRDHGIDPTTVQILSFGGSDFNQYLEKPFRCIIQPTVELGRVACEQLLAEIESDREVMPRVIKLPAATVKAEA
ncbi:MAG: LacI family DNA-binding transcriptional regulator [Bacteroidota bacterium]